MSSVRERGGAHSASVIHPNENSALSVLALLFSGPFTLVMAWFLYRALAYGIQHGIQWFNVILCGVLALAGGGAAARSVRTLLSLRRFGSALLELRGTAESGRPLEGRIVLARPEVLSAVSLRLACTRVRFVRRGSGKNRSTHQERTELWQAELPQVPVAAAGSAASVQFRFDIPANLPGATLPDLRAFKHLSYDIDYYAWELQLAADVPGVDLVRSYNLRVRGADPQPSQVQPLPRPEKLAAAEKVALAELKTGKRPAVVATRLRALGFDGAAIDHVFQSISDQPGSAYTAILHAYLVTRTRTQLPADAARAAAPRPAGAVPAAAPGEPFWSSPSAIVLIAANLVPVAGVLLWGWELLPVMLLFWAENLVVGLFNLLRMLTAAQGGTQRVILIPFFIFHYGMFCFVHGIFVVALFGEAATTRLGLSGFADFYVFSRLLIEYQLLLPLAALLISHGFSYFVNYLGRGEYLKTDAHQQMFAPYGRVVVLHVLVLIGGFTVMALDSPMPMLALLVLLKTALDLIAHRREHAKLATTALPDRGGLEGDAETLPYTRVLLSALSLVALLFTLYFGYAQLAGPGELAAARRLAESAEQARSAAQQQPEAKRPAPVAAPPPAPVQRSKEPPPQKPETPAVPAALVGTGWQADYDRAQALRASGAVPEAERLLQKLLQQLPAEPAQPAAARVLATLAEIRQQAGRLEEYEAGMLQLFETLDAFDPLSLNMHLGDARYALDAELLARQFADHWWERRKYQRALGYYQRAQDLAPVLVTDAAELNRRLAFSAAGVMATACMLKRQALAERNMRDLKTRAAEVDAATRQQLDYWIRTGEPRLRDGRCGGSAGAGT